MADIVEVKNNQTDVYAGPDRTVFDNKTLLTANQPSRGFGTWTLEAGSGTLESPGTYESLVNGLAEGLNSFVWSINIEGCISYDRVQIMYYKLPTASFSISAQSGCPSLYVEFTKTTIENYPFEWSFGENDSVSLEENPHYLYTKSGKYTASLTVTGPDKIPVTKEKVIEVYDLPKINFDLVPNDIYLPDGELRSYNYTEGGNKYLWSFGDGETSDLFNAHHIYADTGYYSVSLKVWTVHQCYDSLYKENVVHVMESSYIKFPSAFTPNMQGSGGGRYNRNDYSNDVFYPIVIMGGIDNYKMEIYNRWGILVFESNNVDIGWDGYYKGKLLQEDVYIYRITGISNSGKKLNVTGDFLLMLK
jgi:gliding motility-associated-like protein